MFATSLNLLLGVTGLVPFGHAAYFGVGAYVCAIFMKDLGVPFLLAWLLGGVGGFIASLFHPHDVPHQTEALLRLVAAAKHWSQLHFLIMLSVVFLVCGLAMLTRNLVHPMARALGTLGRYLVILGGAVYLVEIMIDGFATKFFADHWADAADPAQKAALFTSADAVAHVWFALFPAGDKPLSLIPQEI
jgi:hypothetical protein